MRIFGILLAVAFVTHFKQMEAHNRCGLLSDNTMKDVSFGKQNKELQKVYINSARLYFSDEGIFFQTNSEWKKINHISHDELSYNQSFETCSN